MDITAQCGLHWNYFLALEEDLGRLARYVDLSEDNFHTHSIECARLLKDSCSETENVLKLATSISARGNFATCVAALDEADIRLLEAGCVTVRRAGLVLLPWTGLSRTSFPTWWAAHNKIKHGRAEHLGEANLGNALHALAGLFSALLLCFRRSQMREVMSAPQLFRADERLGMHCMTPEGPIIALDVQAQPQGNGSPHPSGFRVR
jgi:hypothetical protein